MVGWGVVGDTAVLGMKSHATMLEHVVQHANDNNPGQLYDYM